ncbi:hypothetical protein Tther_02536 [Tepidimonas thermarum]|uniref:Uncharacterized protein n=2 Tax=Tepidimonas TaxID=114248 RepID=A0A554WU00_9BURK|nr:MULTISPECIES: hypothetical protein [Burkholderiales genera incertae sedis]MCX7692669.1 hypothetical protein [Tepidimonas taiwanensis]TSE18903.1 hypothetical protein Taqua_02515 [Tepidimonas aquatica]TSE27062.1 hypothetical protein Tther_02536 [Tepidimonas thermarum]
MHESLELYVLPLASHDAEIAGLEAVPGRLPEIWRLPGEPLRTMLRRALREATPGPSFWCSPIIRRPHHE